MEHSTFIISLNPSNYWNIGTIFPIFQIRKLQTWNHLVQVQNVSEFRRKKNPTLLCSWAELVLFSSNLIYFFLVTCEQSCLVSKASKIYASLLPSQTNLSDWIFIFKKANCLSASLTPHLSLNILYLLSPLDIFVLYHLPGVPSWPYNYHRQFFKTQFKSYLLHDSLYFCTLFYLLSYIFFSAPSALNIYY